MDEGIAPAGVPGWDVRQLVLWSRHISEAYDSTAYARPDVLWIARWNNNPSLTDWAGIPDTQWANHQRGKQYIGDHDETYGGVKINIDSNRFDAPVATVGYAYQITSTADLNGRDGPTTAARIVRVYAPGSTVQVVCQTGRGKVGTSSVWNKLADGNYVSDYYVSTPSSSTYSAPLPRCSYPFQVTTTTLNQRTGRTRTTPDPAASLVERSLGYLPALRNNGGD